MLRAALSLMKDDEIAMSDESRSQRLESNQKIDGAALLKNATYLFHADSESFTAWLKGLSHAEFDAYLTALELATGPLPPLSVMDAACRRLH